MRPTLAPHAALPPARRAPRARLALLALVLAVSGGARAAALNRPTLNLATLSCNKYENEILPAAGSDSSSGARTPDAINTVMWLFGYAIGKADEHVMYGDALSAFGFALDAECKNQPSLSLLEALSQVEPKKERPMSLDSLSCESFEARHARSEQSDPESAATIMMWLYGYSVARSGSHFFDPGGAERFETTLKTECTRNPLESLYEALDATGKGAAAHH